MMSDCSNTKQKSITLIFAKLQNWFTKSPIVGFNFDNDPTVCSVITLQPFSGFSQMLILKCDILEHKPSYSPAVHCDQS